MPTLLWSQHHFGANTALVSTLLPTLLWCQHYFGLNPAANTTLAPTLPLRQYYIVANTTLVSVESQLVCLLTPGDKSTDGHSLRHTTSLIQHYAKPTLLLRGPPYNPRRLRLPLGLPDHTRTPHAHGMDKYSPMLMSLCMHVIM